MEISRRQAMKLGVYGLTGGGLGLGVLTAAAERSQLAGALPAAAPQPPRDEIVGVDGVFRGALTVTGDPAWVAGDTANGTITYNGLYPGPTLRMRPGDRVLLDVTNAIDLMVNTHFHGFHVTPGGTGDNVFAMIEPGATFHHDFVIPADHPGGLYWYHPHAHGFVDNEIFRGLSGLIVIEGGAADLPALAGRTHVLMGVRNSYLTGSGDAGGGRTISPEPAPSLQIHTINGALSPTFTIEPGETQLWQIANIGNDPYYRIGIDGHTFTVVAEDGALLWDTYTTDSIVLPPGKRFEIAVTGGVAGSYQIRQLGFNEGPFGNWPAVPLATLLISGSAAQPAVVPAHPAPRVDLADDPIAAHRTIVMGEAFNQAIGEPEFFMNGVLFQNITPAEIVPVTLGTTEEWVIRSDPSLAAGGTAEAHPFHIHINPMVLVGQGTWDPLTNEVLTYQAVNAPGTIDTINVNPSEYAIVRMHFADYTGLSVYHCHLTFHEDHGMMGKFAVNAAVIPAPTPPTGPAAPAASPVGATPKFTG